MKNNTMTQEQKDLLLKDLCGRLPYGVKISVNDNIETLQGINILDTVVEYDSCLSSDIEEVKPYLFPISSMTEEQCYELASICSGFQDCWKYIKTPILLTICNFEQIDWFYKNHLDFRGLIQKGLAIDATNLNIYE